MYWFQFEICHSYWCPLVFVVVVVAAAGCLVLIVLFLRFSTRRVCGCVQILLRILEHRRSLAIEREGEKEKRVIKFVYTCILCCSRFLI